MQYKSLANAMFHWRHSRSYSLNDAAKATGIPQSTFSNYENRKYMPTSESMNLFTNMLNISLDEVLAMSEYDKAIRNNEK
ncbi:helix-turn-helix domain-containing protein [Weissella kandleri]|uniref:helix-turn-helix domain-containing protein n=1 Tax=Weissella kandleri TaxID=1616 RepID=UPI00387E71C9